MAKKTRATPGTPASPRAKAPATTRRRTIPGTMASPARPDNGDGRPGPSHEEIAEAAYWRYLSRGGGHGSDFDDWVEAERELRSRRSR